jgi:serine/threonine-protein kinase HipA
MTVDTAQDVQLAPMFDVLTTTIYKYQKYPGGPELEDNTMALRLQKGKKTKGYPATEELFDFGSRICGVSRSELALERIADAMSGTLIRARQDDRIPEKLIEQMSLTWDDGMLFGRKPANQRVLSS